MTLPNTRIAKTFEKLRLEDRAAFIPFLMAGDPDLETSLDLLKALPEAGADMIELGVCFTDPMADGSAIQAAGLRALKSGQTLDKTLEMVDLFRKQNDETPIILMGYYNPFYQMGTQHFLEKASRAGVDGLIIVDLPPEEDDELCLPAQEKGLDFIRLATPTTDQDRLPEVLRHTSGFVYYVAVAGVTGQKSGDMTQVKEAIAQLRASSSMPVAVGFGIKTKKQAAATAQFADAVVVGSALVDTLATVIADTLPKAPLENDTKNSHNALHKVLTFTRDLAEAVHNARRPDTGS